MKNEYILIINGSYRSDGVTDRIVGIMVDTLLKNNIEVRTVTLREKNIRYCLNCRSCTQLRGDLPGKCVIDDDMNEIVKEILGASGYIFASPTNFFYATALYKCFLERLVVFAYWPWGDKGPKYRITTNDKPAVLISSTAMPSMFARIATDTMSALKATAKTVGAHSVGSLFAGMVSERPHADLSSSVKKEAEELANKLSKKVGVS